MKESDTFINTFYVGFCLLEVSKIIMYDWYYKEILLYFGEHKLDLHFMIRSNKNFIQTDQTANRKKNLSKKIETIPI